MLPGRLLDPSSDGGARGMIVASPERRNARRRGTEFGLRLTAITKSLNHSTNHSFMSSYLVTGGAGFIGSHLAEELLRRGHHVRVADSLITGKRVNLAS